MVGGLSLQQWVRDAVLFLQLAVGTSSRQVIVVHWLPTAHRGCLEQRGGVGGGSRSVGDDAERVAAKVEGFAVTREALNT